MLKKQYKLFLIIFILCIITGAIVCEKFPCNYITASLDSYTFEVSEKADSDTLREAPLMFAFEQGDATKLYCNAEYRKNLSEMYFRYPYDQADSVSVEEFSYQDYMNGTFFVWSKNENENVFVSAKASLLCTQGYDSYAWDTHTFGNEDIPVELSYGGSGVHSTDISVLVYGQPYTGEVYLQTKAGKSENRMITDGCLTGLNIHDIRKGIVLTVQLPEKDQKLIGSYIVEDYPFFTAGYGISMINIVYLIGMIVIGVLAVLLGKKVIQSYITNGKSI